MRKKVLSFLILAAFMLALSPVYAESPISVIVNGTRLKFDAQPVIENGRVLVPVRAIFQALGAEVTWDEDARTATGVKGTRKQVFI